MGFSKQVLHPKEQPSRGGLGPAQAKSRPAPAAPDGRETHALPLPIHLDEKEDAFAGPSREGAPA